MVTYGFAVQCRSVESSIDQLSTTLRVSDNFGNVGLSTEPGELVCAGSLALRLLTMASVVQSSSKRVCLDMEVGIYGHLCDSTQSSQRRVVAEVVQVTAEKRHPSDGCSDLLRALDEAWRIASVC